MAYQSHNAVTGRQGLGSPLGAWPVLGDQYRSDFGTLISRLTPKVAYVPLVCLIVASDRQATRVGMYLPIRIQNCVFVGEVCGPGGNQRGHQRRLSGEAQSGDQDCPSVHRDDTSVNEDEIRRVSSNKHSNLCVENSESDVKLSLLSPRLAF